MMVVVLSPFTMGTPCEGPTAAPMKKCEPRENPDRALSATAPFVQLTCTTPGGPAGF
jgi:hypothetical protein